MKPQMDELKKRLLEIAHLQSIKAVASWDQEVYMPIKGADNRASSLAALEGIIHEKIVTLDSDKLLTHLVKGVNDKDVKGRDAVIVREIWRDFERRKRLPEAFVRELAETQSKSQTIWAQARAKNNFKLFQPWLTKMVELKRQQAKYIGYKDSPYDALLDEYEPGVTSAEIFVILNDLKDFLVPFLKRIHESKHKPNLKRIKGIFPVSEQEKFNELVVRLLGFDMEAGRIDKTTHPFATSFSSDDVRITTRYKEDDVMYSLGSIIHEAGHGLYEQGFLGEYYGTAIAEAVSLGIHESQSRLWENKIGKSEAFWKHFYPKLQKAFPKPYKDILRDEFYQIINSVQPSLIRTESDEVTYNLHIILRFEIEKELIEGSIEVKDLPKIWKSKMKDYFGIEVPTDTVGVLQDVHWSFGLFGYFPTYSLGNLYAAQFYAAMQRDMPDVEKQIAKGDFTKIKAWLRKNIHAHGKTYTASQLVKRVTGESLNSSYFIDYLKKKYSKLYSLK